MVLSIIFYVLASSLLLWFVSTNLILLSLTGRVVWNFGSFVWSKVASSFKKEKN